MRIRVTFDKKNADGKISDDKIEYLLAGTDLVDRAYRSRTQTTSRVLKPGEKIDLFKLGEGPFPLPLGQKKEDVHANFDVSKIEPKNDDPKNSVHLHLVPKPNTRLEKKFKSIDVWVDLKQHMPRARRDPRSIGGGDQYRRFCGCAGESSLDGCRFHPAAHRQRLEPHRQGLQRELTDLEIRYSAGGSSDVNISVPSGASTISTGLATRRCGPWQSTIVIEPQGFPVT